LTTENVVKEILLIRQGGLGDLLAVLPSLNLLREAFPLFRPTLVCREDYGRLFLETGLVEALEPVSRARFSGLFSESGPLPDETATWLAGFDIVVAWAQGPAGLVMEKNIARSGKPCRTIIYEPGRNISVSRFFFEATKESFKVGAAKSPRFEDCAWLPMMSEKRLAARSPLEKLGIRRGDLFAVIHPGAGSRSKRWPLQSFLTVAAHLSRKGIPGLFITGEAEGELDSELDRCALPRSWTRLSMPDIIDVAAYLAESKLYIGNDSGVTHLAGACGTHVLAIFRRENEMSWKPNGRVFLFSADDPASIPVETVIAAVRGFKTADG
jgi:heptosyltransferase-3